MIEDDRILSVGNVYNAVKKRYFKEKSEYNELEYIETTGTQYIDTGYKTTSNTSIEMRCSPTNVSSQSVGGFFYASDRSTGVESYVWDGVITISYNGIQYLSSEQVNAGDIFDIMQFSDRVFVYRENDKKILVNSHSVQALGLSNSNLTLFKLLRESFTGAVKLYSCKIYEGSSIVRDYVPAEKNGVIGLYDKITNTMYENAGTGSFISGPELSYSELQYIESTGIQYIDTGYYPVTETHLSMNVQLSSISPQWKCFYGVRDAYTFTQEYAFWANSTNQYRSNYIDDIGVTGGTLTTDQIIIEQNGPTVMLDGLSFASHPSGTLQANHSLYLLACNEGGTTMYPMDAKLYSCKIYENDIPVRDFVPVTKDATAGLYDKIFRRFYENSGTDNFIEGPVSKPELVPPDDPNILANLDYFASLGGINVSGSLSNRTMSVRNLKIALDILFPYKRLQYIESTGTQYIDTGYYPVTNTHSIIDISMSSVTNQWKCFYGVRVSYPQHGEEYAFWANSTNQYRSNYIDDIGVTAGTVSTDRLIIDQNGPIVTLNSALFANHESGTLDSQYTLYLFACNEQSTTMYPIDAKLYSCKIYTGSTLVRDFIPVKNNKTGEIGLLDQVSNQFYSNSGTGSFIAGPEV